MGSTKTLIENIMKKITILLVLIFIFLLSTKSWGDWNYVTESVSGNKYYYDKDRIIKSGKFIYFWELTDYIKPTGSGDLSTTTYIELDCSVLRYKWLKLQFYNKSLGEGEMTTDMTPPDNWLNLQPKSLIETMYKKICEEH